MIMIARGINRNGERIEFKVNRFGNLKCHKKDLVSLDIPEGVKEVLCYNNLLTDLNIPEGVEYLRCENNLISELNIPKGIKYLICDRNIKGLDNIDWNCDIKLF